jgi:hypothetical protein
VRAEKCVPGRRPRGNGWQAVGLQDPGNRRATHAMSDVLQRALDPGVAPRRIVLRHPDDEALDFFEPAATVRPPLRVRPFPSDELPVPSEQGIGRDDRGHVTQCPTSQSVRKSRETPSVVMSQAKPPTTQLPTEEAILFDQIRERLTLPTKQPADQDGEYLQGQRVDDGGRL